MAENIGQLLGRHAGLTELARREKRVCGGLVLLNGEVGEARPHYDK